MTHDTDSTSDSTSDTDNDHGVPRRERRGMDLTPQRSYTDKYDQTEEGTADPDTIQDPEIRQAVEEARERARDQQDADHADDGRGETTGDADAADAADEPVEADPPQLKEEPEDPDEFFEDTMGDPRREMKEAQAKGLHREESEPADSYNRPTDTSDSDSDTSDTDSDHEDTTMSQNPNTDTDSTSDSTATTIEDEGAPVADYGSGDPEAEADDGGQPATSADAHARAEDNQQARAAAADADGGAPQAEQVEPMGDDEREQVDDAFGGESDEDDAEMPAIEDINFDEQDIEGASEDRGEELIEFNDRYFLLEDVNDERAENLLNALQDENLDAQDRFDVIIDTVVTKPTNAAARVSNWKYLHRATLAGRCMEHCGLDDVVDFPNE